ncbi:toll/interleukin-1 receptor domain-containing protein [Phytohabitans houttuyneae]|nr:toll/interleukin-1 receptor domain-containing protein [Phytohabitans houttuyneae]
MSAPRSSGSAKARWTTANDRSSSAVPFHLLPRSAGDYVAELWAFLARHGIPTWYDMDIPTGERWASVIEGKIASCAGVLVVMSDGADQRRFIRQELDAARDGGKRLFPLLLDGKIYAELKSIQATFAEGGTMPGPSWVLEVRRHLERQHPSRLRRRRWWLLGATAALSVAAALFALYRGPDGTPPGGCEGRPARIEAVSTETPGHTGHRPTITVSVCRAHRPTTSTG